MSDAPPRDDPRFRVHRAVALSVYLVLTLVFCGLIITGVVRSVLSMEPSAAPAGASLSESVCGASLRGLFDELEARRREVANHLVPTESEREWTTFRADWLQRFTGLRGQCSGQGAPTLDAAFSQVDTYLSAATVNAVQFSTELGPVLAATRAALDAAPR
ncbi:MAG: hypothetical protein JNG84_11740 [Archangium sp.]|nr:hypothetical protein [Archangium sp.]